MCRKNPWNVTRRAGRMVVTTNGEPPQWFTTCIILSVQSAMGTLAFLNLLTSHPPASHTALYLVGFFLVLGLQAVHCAERAARIRARAGRWTLALQAALTYGLLPVLGLPWAGMPGFLAGSILLALELPLSAVLFCAAAGFTGAYAWLVSQHLLGIGLGILSCVVNGLMVYGMTLMASWSVELRRARDEIARLAVQEERLRVARDLHDLLGYSLSAITLKGELTGRLIQEGSEGEAGRARAELREMVDISRQALADVRCVAQGYRRLSLTAELTSAARVLEAADITVRIHDARPSQQEETGTVLATVVREGVTNILRHSAAHECRITVVPSGAKLVLTLWNDGAPGDARRRMARRRDGGLGNLARRLEEAGGAFRAGPQGRGRFLVRAECPVKPVRELSGSSPSPSRSGRRPADSVR